MLLLLSIVASFMLPIMSSNWKSSDSDPKPTPWPHQFHSVLFMNYSGSLEMIDLWYDWPNGRNFNIVQRQLGKLLYDLEWNNGTSFFYTLDSTRECRSVQLEVGILRPNWLDGANYLGQRNVSGFLCNVWEKVDFIWYYEDVVSKKPVRWVFYTGREANVMTFEVGAVLEDAKWQAPAYCFDKNFMVLFNTVAAKQPKPLARAAAKPPRTWISTIFLSCLVNYGAKQRLSHQCWKNEQWACHGCRLPGFYLYCCSASISTPHSPLTDAEIPTTTALRSVTAVAVAFASLITLYSL
ncbi:hypothetical protein L6164_010804 [Bauhinia variegata]|uniref:Uncharacterized protein n=1 Tax=Bauhinia variegata TaxID=167791 RepID=A0ACB9P934_BAUVA|nr:hypothetical protein L6164_010804 [Bauhinia variegata]